MTTATWAKMGSLVVPAGAAEEARRSGRAVQVYPEGLEALASYQLAPGATNASAMGKRLGSSGVEPESGIIDNLDHNKRIPPRVWRGSDTTAGLVDTIVREDPVAKAVKLAWCLPITRSAWTIEPNGDDRQALEIAEFVRACLWEHLTGGFQQFVEHAVSMVWRGFSLAEIVVQFDRAQQRTLLSELAPILPRTVSGWLRYPGGAWGIQQYQYQGDDEAGGVKPPGSSGPVNLAPEKLLHFVWDADGDAPEGTSILRPCYAGWKQRRLYLKLEAAGYERGAFGIPVLTIDPSARQADSSIANEILRELRTGARAWATFPPGYDLKFADFPMKGAEIREARIAAGQDMARAALAPFLFTGEKAGAFSLIRGQMDFFQLGLQAAADSIASVMSNGSQCLIKRLVSWNFEGVTQFPKLVPGSISLGDPVGLINAIKTAADGQLLTPDEGLEESIRTALGLPEMPEQTLEQWRAEVVGSPQEVGAPTESTPAPKAAEVSGDDRDEAEDEGAEMEALAERYVSLVGYGQARSGRPLRPEESVVRLDETLSVTEGAKEAMARAVGKWRSEVAPKYADRVATVAAKDASKIPSITVPDQGRLVQILIAELRRVYRAGKQSVEAEVERIADDPELAKAIEENGAQATEEGFVVEEDLTERCRHGRRGLDWLVKLQDEDDPDLPLPEQERRKPTRKRTKAKAPRSTAEGKSIVDDLDPDKAITAISKTTAAKVANRIQDETMTGIQAQSLGGAISKEVAKKTVLDLVADLSLGKDAVNAQRDVNTVFGLGRIQQARAEDVKGGIYSTMLESDTCAACAALDGFEFTADQADQYATPNPDCAGGDQCNCLLLFLPR